ncbi:polyketide synthase [Ruminococcus sp.]|uniref:polyketide synthase n=1 Tax=Ruminococcus sp. TaxID=41978 RepID=UPI0025DCDEAC|nr:polyketide synthase [Ruminococcus sp.]MCR4639217.1 polyketide synthase [Ruminococcus sp.]
MDIAIIGADVKNSVAENMEEFHKALYNGKCGSLCSIEQRCRMTGRFDHEKDMGNLRCMSGIEKFDYRFFGLSKREARRLSPEIRLSMNAFVNTVYDAGYSLESIRGSDMGLILCLSSSEDYRSLFPVKDAFTYMGSSITAMAGAQLSYRFDLRGPVFIIDSTCCSSAAALHDACLCLAAGECGTIAVGAVETALFLKEGARQELDSMGVFTKKDHCCPMDKECDGIIPGEAVGFVILKPLEAAVRDGDHIYAVIKGSAVNSNGSTSRDITSPSKEAEINVTKKAFERAGVSADDITECELHAAGTPIGDRIEFQALSEIYGKRNEELPVGSVKANIGHTGKVSGLSAVLKVICGFLNDTVYPVANLNNIDPELELGGGILRPVTVPAKYSSDKRRIADIASYGINGTNVHIIAEKYDDRTEESPKEMKIDFLKISASTEENFFKYRDALSEFFGKFKGNIADALYTLNSGRDDLRYRAVVPVSEGDLSEVVMKVQPFDCLAGTKSEISDTEQYDNADLSQLWLSGGKIDWKKIYYGTKCRRITAPWAYYPNDSLWAFEI